MDILQATRGRLASDTYSFEQPLRLDENSTLSSSFFINGMRHRHLPNEWPSWIKEHGELHLVPEPKTKYDRHAVAVFTKGGNHLGYVPSFYSNAIFSLIENGLTPIVKVVNMNESSHPHWWLQVKFECKVPLEQGKQIEEL
ncbi:MULTISPECIES: HIRAN domain-containing protein [unclassified Sporosarcina]|uniref:HIRAN domain-containing protein n=1 Tax=unclassified Sporosarcina TaxID=2647733 RepID=UPI001E299C12|nr:MULTISPECIES: HIRAN domain-containing protein [unclassified Sporosarcina]